LEGFESNVVPRRRGPALPVLLLILLVVLGAHAQEPPTKATPPTLASEISSFDVPKLDSPPRLSDFEGMEPATSLARRMLKVDRFLQRDPHDGAPVSQRTEAYLGYTERSFYVVFLAFDSSPKLMRARMLRREQIDDDDQVGLFLDTFHDHRHAYMFYSNPFGIQQDAIFSETDGPDLSWDTVWRTQAKITNQGYMVQFDIPFKSMRFQPTPEHTFGILLGRVIPRNSERSYFPENSSAKQGWLIHEGDIKGFEQISPGRNIQFIPYTSLSAFRDLDQRDPAGDRFSGKHLQPKEGVDAKVVLKDSLVLDATVNPDFGQIESDDPQVTVNQRFEVFFPEKRPFFQENSSYFATPMALLFTRRVVDPLYGVRLTGKAGPWAIGSFIANDRAPGKAVIDTDPLSGNNAFFGVLRINRELGNNNSIGFIYTDRELNANPNSFCTLTECIVSANRVGGFDTQVRINQNWHINAQAVTSVTEFSNGTRLAGPAYRFYGEYTTRKVEFNSAYDDISPGFTSEAGFIPRADMRRITTFGRYSFRPEGKILTAHGPFVTESSLWDHNGSSLLQQGQVGYEWDFQRNSLFNIFELREVETLRPVDFSALTENRAYQHNSVGGVVSTQYFKWVNLNIEYDLGTATNFVPAIGPPTLSNYSAGTFRAVVRPTKRLTVDNTYLLTRLRDQTSDLNIFNNHIFRSKWNYQFTKEFSLRVIGQYDTTLGNPGLTSLVNTKHFNGDVLFTYMVTPGTAIYAGYNSNLQNLDPTLQHDLAGNLLRTRNTFINDGRQIFLKASYLFRY